MARAWTYGLRYTDDSSVSSLSDSLREKFMRMLMTVSIPVESGNRAIADGSLPKIVQSILEEQKPEAAYFTTVNGTRTAYVVVDMKSASDLPALAEPWFLALNASVETTPAMNVQDLGAAGPGMESAVRKYGALVRGAGAD
jgi:hypothetical protein